VGVNGPGVKLPELPGRTSEHKVEGEPGVRSMHTRTFSMSTTHLVTSH